MAAMLDDKQGTLWHLLSLANVSADAFRQAVIDNIEQMPKVSGDHQLYLSKESQAAFQASENIANDRGDEYISSECFLLASFDLKNRLGRVCQQF